MGLCRYLGYLPNTVMIVSGFGIGIWCWMIVMVTMVVMMSMMVMPVMSVPVGMAVARLGGKAEFAHFAVHSHLAELGL